MAEGEAAGTPHQHQQQPPNSHPSTSDQSQVHIPTPIPISWHRSGRSFQNFQGMNVSGSQSFQDAIPQMFAFSSIVAPQQNQESGPGLYAVPCSPFMGTMAEFPPGTLIPLSYKIPTRTNPTSSTGEEQGQGQEAVRQQHGLQRQVAVRRFQFALQLDLGLILKLVAVVILFGQEGSRQRFFLICFLASLVYLYQTGALTPLIQYLRQAAGPPPLRRAENDGVVRGPEDNAANENQPAEGGEPPAANRNQQAPARGNRVNWIGIAREIQTFVVGFIASLLPGFHHHDD
ncbi:uncharacterized protein M6B38_382385 [Iris pallida]|uniref:Uncharacterized protein n=1 Tax=Iris pallida TaxID=29817 RepID=A0AAX6G0K7_IRIPA|nr:uncharacterized protein M6B38_390325 [Iris pallida]KAJ6824624.1 uncharacterized protein M6B38_382385 [Iris pallida]